MYVMYFDYLFDVANYSTVQQQKTIIIKMATDRLSEITIIIVIVLIPIPVPRTVIGTKIYKYDHLGHGL